MNLKTEDLKIIDKLLLNMGFRLEETYGKQDWSWASQRHRVSLSTVTEDETWQVRLSAYIDDRLVSSVINIYTPSETPLLADYRQRIWDTIEKLRVTLNHCRMRNASCIPIGGVVTTEDWK